MDSNEMVQERYSSKGFLLGVLVGGGLAIIFAPRKGSELRASVKQSLDDIRTKKDAAIYKAQQKFKGETEKMKNVSDKAKTKIDKELEHIYNDDDSNNDEKSAADSSSAKDTQAKK